MIGPAVHHVYLLIKIHKYLIYVSGKGEYINGKHIPQIHCNTLMLQMMCEILVRWL